MRTQAWAAFGAAAVMLVIALGLFLSGSHSAAATATGPAASLDDCGLLAVPITQDGDTVGYNVYFFSKRQQGGVWAWEHGKERRFVRVPLED